jgi:hypothetical protein
MVSHYPVFFQAQAEQLVEGARPDVTLVQQSFYLKARGGDFYARRLARSDPDLAGVAGAFLERKVLDWDELMRVAALRPVRLEPAEDLPVPAGDVRAAGWTFAAAPGAGLGGAVDRDAGVYLADLRRAFRWPDPDLETRRVLIRRLAAGAGWLAAAGARGAAAAGLEAALELNPRDRLLRRLRDGL